MCVPYAEGRQWLCDLREPPCSMGAKYLKEELSRCEGAPAFFYELIVLKTPQTFPLYTGDGNVLLYDRVLCLWLPGILR